MRHGADPIIARERRLRDQGIAGLLDRQPDLAPRAALYDLADSLATLMDEMQGESVAPATIAALDVSDHSAHWARTREFLRIVTPYFTGVEAPDAETRQRLAVTRELRQCRLPLTGSLGFAKAEVTAGGVRLDEVDSKTLSSRRHPGLFLAGEVLDLDGPIGGFNFQAAFATGWLAGERILA